MIKKNHDFFSTLLLAFSNIFRCSALSCVTACVRLCLCVFTFCFKHLQIDTSKHHISLVVSPLRALMRDQCRELTDKGVQCTPIFKRSEMSQKDIESEHNNVFTHLHFVQYYKRALHNFCRRVYLFRLVQSDQRVIRNFLVRMRTSYGNSFDHGWL